MKTLFLLAALFFAGVCMGQSIYQSIETVEADGITFVVKRAKYASLIYNSDYHYINESPLHYKDGRELETKEEYEAIDAQKNTAGELRALREVFGDDFITAMRAYKRSEMIICYVVDSDGKILEIAFIVSAQPEFMALPMTTFAALERKLRQYVTWKPNDFAKQLEYFNGRGYINFHNVPISSEIKVIKNDFLWNQAQDGELHE
ncbi:MAG: DUF5043 domain-containing protein [Alistipes sp.]|nr:DUF5043 domain-containing protein [Alistipes sp.]